MDTARKALLKTQEVMTDRRRQSIELGIRLGIVQQRQLEQQCLIVGLGQLAEPQQRWLRIQPIGPWCSSSLEPSWSDWRRAGSPVTGRDRDMAGSRHQKVTAEEASHADPG